MTHHILFLERYERILLIFKMVSLKTYPHDQHETQGQGVVFISKRRKTNVSQNGRNSVCRQSTSHHILQLRKECASNAFPYLYFYCFHFILNISGLHDSWCTDPVLFQQAHSSLRCHPLSRWNSDTYLRYKQKQSTRLLLMSPPPSPVTLPLRMWLKLVVFSKDKVSVII